MDNYKKKRLRYNDPVKKEKEKEKDIDIDNDVQLNFGPLPDMIRNFLSNGFKYAKKGNYTQQDIVDIIIMMYQYTPFEDSKYVLDQIKQTDLFDDCSYIL